MRTIFRSFTLLALASAAVASQAVDAYSNKPAGDYFRGGYGVDSTQSLGYLFTSTTTGSLTGFDVAINNYLASGPAAFTLRLYADGGGTLGSLLGTFSGTTSGHAFPTTSGYDAVAASGVNLTSGASYWLVASSSESLAWNWIDRTTTQSYAASSDGTNFAYHTGNAGVFSVQVAPIASATPGPAAALPFALMALRRRKKA